MCSCQSLNRVISYQVFECISDYSPDSSEYVKDEGDCERAEVILTDLHGDFGGVGGDARVVGFLLLGLLHAGGASAKITGLSLLGLATLLWSSGQKEKHWSCNTYRDFVSCMLISLSRILLLPISCSKNSSSCYYQYHYIWSTTGLSSTDIQYSQDFSQLLIPS